MVSTVAFGFGQFCFFFFLKSGVCIYFPVFVTRSFILAMIVGPKLALSLTDWHVGMLKTIHLFCLYSSSHLFEFFSFS